MMVYWWFLKETIASLSGKLCLSRGFQKILSTTSEVVSWRRHGRPVFGSQCGLFLILDKDSLILVGILSVWQSWPFGIFRSQQLGVPYPGKESLGGLGIVSFGWLSLIV